MNRSPVLPLYLVLLAGHVAHVFEEVWGRFWLIAAYGLERFLIANWVLFCVSVALFYFVLRGRRWAYTVSMVYAGVMVLNGMGHNIMTMLTGRYFDGFAGGYTGIGLLLAAAPVLYFLWRERPAA